MEAFRVEVFCLLVIGILIVAFRCTARLLSVGRKGLWADDYLMPFAIVIYTLESVAALLVGVRYHGLANNGMSTAEREGLSPTSTEYEMRVNGSKLQLVGWTLYTLLLWTLKLCVCVFYHRLLSDMGYLRTRVIIGYSIICITYIATLLSIFLGCPHFSANWQISPNPGNFCQPAISRIDLYVTVVLNVLSDMYLLTIPLPLLLKANIAWSRKVSLIALFSGAIFVMAAGCLRCALVITDPVKGAQAAGSWAVRETFVAIVVANAPILYQGYRKLLRPRVLGFVSEGTEDTTTLRTGRVMSTKTAPAISFEEQRARWLVHPATRSGHLDL